MIAEPRVKSAGNHPSRPHHEDHGQEAGAVQPPRNQEQAEAVAQMPAHRTDHTAYSGADGSYSRREQFEFDADEEEAHWEAAHGDQPFAGDDDYIRYASAYRIGFEGYIRLGAENTFDDVEEELQEEYEAEGSTVPWEKVREASRAAWERIEQRMTP